MIRCYIALCVLLETGEEIASVLLDKTIYVDIALTSNMENCL